MNWDWRKFITGLVAATFVALLIRLFVLEDYRISSNSMRPTLLAGDLVVTSKLAYNLHLPFSNFEFVRVRKPTPGEIVAFALPEEGMKTFLKRVVAVEGDSVEIKDGGLVINNKPLFYRLEKDAIIETLPNNVHYTVDWDRMESKQFGPVDVPKEHFFVLSDDRDDGVDSRVWGPIPGSCLKGKAKFIWLSKDPEAGFRWSRFFSAVR